MSGCGADRNGSPFGMGGTGGGCGDTAPPGGSSLRKEAGCASNHWLRILSHKYSNIMLIIATADFTQVHIFYIYI